MEINSPKLRWFYRLCVFLVIIMQVTCKKMETLKLYNGYEVPIVGFGTYRVPPEVTVEVIKNAIDVGYRHFDCGWYYGNEKEIGIALQEKIKDGTVTRDELFISSKLWNNFHSKDQVVPSLKDSLEKLQLDYLDLYIIHWPYGFKLNASKWPVGDGPSAYSDTDYIETWEGMEECLHQNLTRSIGISNFNSSQLTRLLEAAKVKPAVHQFEVNPNINQKEYIKFNNDKDIAVVGYCPLGGAVRNRDFYVPALTILDPEVIKIGEKHNKTAAQVVLKYLLGLGVAVIPKTVRKERMIENISLFDFELNKEDVDYLDSLNKNERVVPLAEFSDHIYYPFADLK